MTDDLLEQAEHLARREPGRPRQVSLRRAVSAAYYAVFHALAALCANTLVGYQRPWSVYVPMYRSLDHGSIKRVQRSDPRKAFLSTDCHRVLDIAVQLQDRRHVADYDPQPGQFGRYEVLDDVARAREAVRLLASLPFDDRMRLSVHLIAKQR